MEIMTEEHKVIRTKAVKCTKAVNVIPRLLDNQTAENHILGPKLSESTTASEGLSSSATHEDNSNDFLMDFEIDELIVSDAPISDFHQIQQVDENGDNAGENGEYRNGFNLIDEVELYSSVDEEAARPSDLFQTSETLDLRSLASYLNLEDEWFD